jgi:hypothetical protein
MRTIFLQTWRLIRHLIGFEQPEAYQCLLSSSKRYIFHLRTVFMEICGRPLQTQPHCMYDHMEGWVTVLLTWTQGTHWLSHKPFSSKRWSYGMARYRWCWSRCRRDWNVLFLWRSPNDIKFYWRGMSSFPARYNLLTHSVYPRKHFPFCCLWKFW